MAADRVGFLPPGSAAPCLAGWALSCWSGSNHRFVTTSEPLSARVYSTLGGALGRSGGRMAAILAAVVDIAGRNRHLGVVGQLVLVDDFRGIAEPMDELMPEFDR